MDIPTEQISTQASFIYLYLTVPEGKFVKQDYSGVILSISDSQKTLKIDGSLQNINKLLTNKVAFSLKNTSLSTLDIQITIIDHINYDIDLILNISKCTFIRFNFEVLKNINKSLQSQFDYKFSDSIINIQTDF